MLPLIRDHMSGRGLLLTALAAATLAPAYTQVEHRYVPDPFVFWFTVVSGMTLCNPITDVQSAVHDRGTRVRSVLARRAWNQRRRHVRECWTRSRMPGAHLQFARLLMLARPSLLPC
jgi:hypothetical protein